MRDTKQYKLGELIFSISGSGKVFQYLKEEFSALPAPTGSPNIDIQIILSNGLPSPPHGSVYTKTHVGWNSGFQSNSDQLSYQLTRQDGNYTVVVDVKNAATNAPYALARKFIDLSYLSPAQNRAKNFMYNCFNLITGPILLEKGMGCYLHASSMSKGGKGIALIANGGIGKTTSMLHLVSRKGWRYLSDDIALLDRSGNLIQTPLRMQIYAYNLPGNEELKRDLMKGRSLLDKAAWLARLYVKGAHRTRRRVTASELFGSDKIANTAPCDALFFMERMFIDEARVDECDSAYIVTKLAHLMPKEVGGLNELSDALELVECGLHEFRRSAFTASIIRFFESNPTSIPAYKISIPQQMSAASLVDYMESVLDGLVPDVTN